MLPRYSIVLLLGVFAVASLPLASATYWNYGFYGAEPTSDGSVTVYRYSCSGYGTPAPLIVVSSVPNPQEDCRSGYAVLTTPSPGDVGDTVGGAVGDVLKLVPELEDDPTYWNYGFYGVGYENGQVVVYRYSCAGYGTPAPLIVFGSVPDPTSDCNTRSAILTLP